MEMSKRALSLLGLACGAGKAVSGFTAVNKAVEAGRAHLLLLDGGMTQDSRDKYFSLAKKHSVPCITAGEGFCAYMGHPERKAAAVCDAGFSAEILKEINNTLINAGVFSGNE